MELLERGPFLSTLDDYAADAGSGMGRLVLVHGEAASAGPRWSTTSGPPAATAVSLARTIPHAVATSFTPDPVAANDTSSGCVGKKK